MARWICRSWTEIDKRYFEREMLCARNQHGTNNHRAPIEENSAVGSERRLVQAPAAQTTATLRFRTPLRSESPTPKLPNITLIQSVYFSYFIFLLIDATDFDMEHNPIEGGNMPAGEQTENLLDLGAGCIANLIAACEATSEPTVKLALDEALSYVKNAKIHVHLVETKCVVYTAENHHLKGRLDFMEFDAKNGEKDRQALSESCQDLREECKTLREKLDKAYVNSSELFDKYYKEVDQALDMKGKFFEENNALLRKNSELDDQVIVGRYEKGRLQCELTASEKICQALENEKSELNAIINHCQQECKALTEHFEARLKYKAAFRKATLNAEEWRQYAAKFKQKVEKMKAQAGSEDADDSDHPKEPEILETPKV